MRKTHLNMKKLLLWIVLITISYTSFADQLDGLAIFDFLIWFLLIGAVSLLGLVISAVIRFAQKEHKVSRPLNFFASALSACVLISIVNLESSIDPGFSAFCIGSIVLSLLLVILNYRAGIKKTIDE